MTSIIVARRSVHGAPRPDVTHSPLALTSDAASAAHLRDARERAGLTLREVASLARLSWVTILEAERGRDLRLSTLRRLRDALPGTTERGLFEGDEAVPAASALGAWAWFSRVADLEVEHLVHHVRIRRDGTRRTRTLLLGVRPRLGGPIDERAVHQAMHLVWLGTPGACPALAGADFLGASRLSRPDGADLHSYRWRGGARGGIFDYSCRPSLPHEGPTLVGAGPVQDPDDGASVLVALPVRHARLRVTFDAGAPLPHPQMWHAWWWADEAWGEKSDDLSLRLGAPAISVNRRPARRSLELHVERPLPCLRLGLRWGREPTVAGASPAPRPVERGAAVGVMLAAERQRLSWSQRRLAEALGVSPRTVSAIERGRDPMRSTLRAYLREMPWLRPADFFEDARREVDRASVAALFRELLGAGSESISHRLVINPDGSGVLRSMTCRLRRLSHSADPMALRELVQDSRRAGPAFRLEHVAVTPRDAPGLTTRVAGCGPGGFVHELLVPGARAARGVTLERKVVMTSGYPFTEAEFRRLYGDSRMPSWCLAESISRTTRRLTITVRLPPGAQALRPELTATPLLSRGPARCRNILAALHPEGAEVMIMRSGAMRIRLDDPLPGVTYMLIWRLP